MFVFPPAGCVLLLINRACTCVCTVLACTKRNMEKAKFANPKHAITQLKKKQALVKWWQQHPHKRSKNQFESGMIKTVSEQFKAGEETEHDGCSNRGGTEQR